MVFYKEQTTYKYREDIRNEYVKAITYALPLVETFKDIEV